MTTHLSTDDLRALFSSAMSDMYKAEVPRYGTLLDLVADVNAGVLERTPLLAARLRQMDELGRLGVERHGAIRLGTAAELAMMRRVFAVMGMHPVGYYDLSVADVPVHSTAFRPITDAALRRNPFRVFTSLLRFDLIADPTLRAQAHAILEQRRIFTPQAIELVAVFEREGGLTAEEGQEFVHEALETFRWHGEATVDAATYRRLCDAHRLIADIVSFKGPHINHLTPRTLDIDAVQALMPSRGIMPKTVIEGPPLRDCPILLRQTSFKALEEPVAFRTAADDGGGAGTEGTHTARFGEIEQRGVALTFKGRKLYDELLAGVEQRHGARADAAVHAAALAARFKAFPDTWEGLRAAGLAFFRYEATDAGVRARRDHREPPSTDDLIQRSHLRIDPIVYEDFLPVSAAGIFQSNLGAESAGGRAAGRDERAAFEAALGRPVLDEFELYARAEAASLQLALTALGFDPSTFASAASVSGAAPSPDASPFQSVA